MIRCWRLDDDLQSLVIGSSGQHLAEIIYWGPRLPDAENLDAIYRAQQIDVTGGMLDSNPELSLCPEASRSFPGQPGLIVQDSNGEALNPKFCFQDYLLARNSLQLHYCDPLCGFAYIASFSINPDTHIIEALAELESDNPVQLRWFSAPVFPAPQYADEIIDFSGRWCGEFQMNRTPWSAGIRCRENRSGRTGHEHFPGLILPCRGATNTQGMVYAFHYGWSGGHRMNVEELADGRRQVQFGHAQGAESKAACHFSTASLYASYSQQGLNGCAIGFQRHFRDYLVNWPKPDRPRPVHYNCWEAVYFDHNLTELKEIAEKAAALGAERFVLDDGWFKNRDNDSRALSDWEVDPVKYPEGLDPLIDHVKALGMTFGIWFEPEMINPDSMSYRQHPQWVLGSEDQILGRNQMVLDMALPEVRDYLFARIAAILRNHDIDYIKWDHNRVLPLPDAEQTRGSYTLFDRLRSEFPLLEIETCASGGGRIDAGILQRTQRVWLSDSNDALERLQIQHNAALFLPSAITGSHVGPRVCHSSGRLLNISFRAWVAAQRHMGFELDPRELNEYEEQVLLEVTNWWKANRQWLYSADILRLDSADPTVIAEQQLARDGSRFVCFAGHVRSSAQISPRPLCLTRLEPDAEYRIELVNRADAVHLSRGNQALKTDLLILRGSYLMHNGVHLPWNFPQSIWVLYGEKL